MRISRQVNIDRIWSTAMQTTSTTGAAIRTPCKTPSSEHSGGAAPPQRGTDCPSPPGTRQARREIGGFGAVALRGLFSGLLAVVATSAWAAGPDLSGSWCSMSQYNANSGGSQHQTCFDLHPDGTYAYGYEGSSSGPNGGVSGSSSDAGWWRASGNVITVRSRTGTTTSYRYELRNHPRNGDPMICVEGQCFVTVWARAPW
jgi:hypothetical protein